MESPDTHKKYWEDYEKFLSHSECIGFKNCNNCDKIYNTNDHPLRADSSFNACKYYVQVRNFESGPGENPIDTRCIGSSPSPKQKLAVTEILVTITLPNGQTYSVRELQPDWLDLEHNLGNEMLRRCLQPARDREGLAEELAGP